MGGGWYGPDVPDRRLYVTDAIVLSRFDYGEADRILTLLTPELGKIKAIAKGIRRPTSRIGGSLEPLAELRVQLARGRTFDVVTQVTMQHAWLGLRDDLEVTATAWYCAELVDRSLEERHAAEPLYLLLRRAYELLDAGMAPARVARWFEMRLCDELGVRPEVDRCVECDRLLEPDDDVRWMPLVGGVLCERHPGPSHGAAGLTTDALRVLKAYQRMDVEGIAGLRLPAAVEAEVERVMGEFVRHVMERDTRSRRFLEEVRAGYQAAPRAPAPASTSPAAASTSPAAGEHVPGARRRRIAMIDPTTPAGARTVERLQTELILWLTTVTPGGQPQTSPVWFLWADGEILLYSRADTPRLANIRGNPRVAANLDGDRDGGDVVVIEGEARVVHEQATLADVPPTYVDKYAEKLAAFGWTMESMLVDYPAEIRIRPTRVRAW